MEEQELQNIEQETKAIEKKKSTKRLFWLFVGFDIVLVCAIIYLVIAIFIHYFG